MRAEKWYFLYFFAPDANTQQKRMRVWVNKIAFVRKEDRISFGWLVGSGGGV